MIIQINFCFSYSERKQRPNLVLFAIDATGKRDIGPQSKLANSLRLYTNQDLNFIDQNNLVVVLTNAISMEPNFKKWKIKAEEKKKTLENFIFQILGWTPPIVFLENEPPGSPLMPRRNQWTEFPNGEYQPLNLFLTIKELLMSGQDLIGKNAIREFFIREKTDSELTVTRDNNEELASIQGKVPMTHEEMAVEAYLRNNEVTAATSASATSSSPSLLDRSQVDQKYRDVSTWREGNSAAGMEIDNDQLDQEWKEHQIIPEAILIAEHYVIGKGYDPRTGRIMGEQIFKSEQFPRCVTYYRGHKSNVRILNANSKNKSGPQMSVSASIIHPGGQELKEARFEGGLTSRMTDNEKKEVVCLQISNVKIAIQMDFKEKLSEKKEVFNASFIDNLEKLPCKEMLKWKDKLDSGKAKSKKPKDNILRPFKDFFDKFGVEVIFTAQCGGQLDVEMSTSTHATEDDYAVKGTMEFLRKIFGASSHASNDSTRFQNKVVTNMNFEGGNHSPQVDLENPGAWKDAFDNWKESLATSPHFMVLDPQEKFSAFIKRLNWLKSGQDISSALDIAYDHLYVPTRKDIGHMDRELDEELSKTRCSLA